MTPPFKVAIVDDHGVCRLGLRLLLERDGLATVIGEAADAPTALALVQASAPDVLVTELMLPGDEGMGVTREVRRRFPGTQVVVLSGSGRLDLVAYALESGAAGYVLKGDPTEELRLAVAAAMGGQRYLSSGIDGSALDERARNGDGRMPLDALSPREREVFQLQTRGLSSKQIARQLFISDKTVQTHRTRIFRKLRVHSAAELVRFAAVHGLIAP
jgi:DNA-binding NarL/FixJ family response regulator